MFDGVVSSADSPRLKGNMVKYTTMKFAVAMAVVVAGAVALADWRVAVPPLPESPYADGEISTSVFGIAR